MISVSSLGWCRRCLILSHQYCPSCRNSPARFSKPPTSSQPFSILHPLRDNQVTLVPASQLMSVHGLPVRSTLVTLAMVSLAGGSGKSPWDQMSATESRIAFGLKRAGSVLSMTFGLKRDGPGAAEGIVVEDFWAGSLRPVGAAWIGSSLAKFACFLLRAAP